MQPHFLSRRPPWWAFEEVLEGWDACAGIASADATERVSGWTGRKGLYTLSQGTAANQPILLPYSGTNYYYSPGVAGNSAKSTASAFTNAATLDYVARLSLNDFTTPAAYVVCDAQSGSPNVYFGSAANRMSFWNGSTILAVAITGLFTNYQYYWFRWKFTNSGGTDKVDFYWAPDSETVPSSWTQISTQQSTSTGQGTKSSGTGFAIGENYGGTTNTLLGKAKRVLVYNGHSDAGGTVVFDSNFTLVSEGATTFTESSSNGATVTINSTGAKPAQIVGSQQLLFDGSAHYIQSGNLTLNQPCVGVGVMRINAYNAVSVMFAGKQADTAWIFNSAGTNLAVYAGSTAGAAAGPATGAHHVFNGTLNGASSSWGYDLNAVNTGNAGASNPGGVTIGAQFLGNSQSAIQVKSFAVCNSALSTARLNQLIVAMNNYYKAF